MSIQAITPIKPEPAANFDAEIKALRDCGSLPALAETWKKFDAHTKHALASEKDSCKSAIESAEIGAQA